jgi:putative DNA primase/helicase
MADDEGIIVDLEQKRRKTKAKAPGFSEDACALAFIDHYAKVLRYCAGTRQWWWWNEKRWVKDDHNRAFAFIREMIRAAFVGRDYNEKKKAGSSAFCAGVERLTRADQRIQATVDTFDAHPMLLGTPGGTVNLKTGELLPSEPSEFISKSTAVAPAAPGTSCPVFEKFISEVAGGKPEVVAFLKRWFGYCLTGETSEECFLFFHGIGKNGKSTLLKIISRIFGDYARNAGMETFVNRRHDQEIARLAGARLVTATETKAESRIDDGLIKRLTGRDKITANFMHQNSFEFIPTFKILIIGNIAPDLGPSVGAAIRRRIRLVAFDFVPKEPDTELDEKLEREAPAILRWCIDGCLEWLRDGLHAPPDVMASTDSYLEIQDVFAEWFEQNWQEVPGNEVSAADLYRSWRQYAVDAGELPYSKKWLSNHLQEKGYKPTRIRRGARGYRGIGRRPWED